ncbi:hypothetical protein [Streptomyces sp. NPDC090056]|uniref:hypothetical protein n=1 Tax=Streptomyces sp. NPDC090056 TaxID=3365934 RepID=UPI0037F4B437
MLDLSELTEGARTGLVRRFMTEYAVSEPTAQAVTTVFLTIAASVPQEQRDVKFQQAVQHFVAQSESWATEFAQKALTKLEESLSLYRETYQRALAAGQDPAAELARVHHMPDSTAAEIVGLLRT